MNWIVEKFFPKVVTYVTHPLHILFLLGLWIALLGLGQFTGFELVGGNYTNGASATVSAIVLLNQVGYHRKISKLQQIVEDIHRYHRLGVKNDKTI